MHYDAYLLSIKQTYVSEEEVSLATDESIINNYISVLRRIDTWCDELEILILANLLNIVIVVFQQRNHQVDLWTCLIRPQRNPQSLFKARLIRPRVWINGST